MNRKLPDVVGRGLLGFPGSEILAATFGTDYLMNGPLCGEVWGTVTVRLADGQVVSIPEDLTRVRTYERKV